MTMPLDPIIAPLLAHHSGEPVVTDDYDALRAQVRRNVEAGLPQLAEPGPEVRSVEDHEIPVRDGSVVLRVYRPFTDGPHPIHLYFHGGGWVLGSVFDRSTDILVRDDDAAYVERLNEAGVPARFRLHPGQVHSTAIFTKISPAARAWRNQIVEALRSVDGPERHVTSCGP
ncbi:hypothetical protein [Myceligenerans indicum]|uniref:Alpha/beta hydrolase n=1 Tax=Myceligenerans indicum TaxID=2593663 RepID=A0ABS1LLL9_9MICO|nr:hypothetical protein [Myceligenerans indicum]MBL0887137.1 hypothetical protein [Myceligenerans indicum]